jgi:hypothetical protein
LTILFVLKIEHIPLSSPIRYRCTNRDFSSWIMTAQGWMTKASLLVFNITICTTFNNYKEIVIFEDLFIINSIVAQFQINYFDLYGDYLFLFDIKRGRGAQPFVIFVTCSDFAGWIILYRKRISNTFRERQWLIIHLL